MRRLLVVLWPATVALLVAVVVMGAVLWALQRKLIYLPDQTSPPPAGMVFSGAQDVVLRTDDGLELDAWHIPPRAAEREVAVLVAPGNAANREARLPFAAELAAEGLTVLLVDYRGYGGNPGDPSEEGLARDVRAAQRYLTEQAGVPPDRQIYFGESLGAAVVTELATERPPGGLVLRSPFWDLASVARVHYPFLPVRMLLRDHYPLGERISEVSVPTVVVYGQDDSIVPANQSHRVAEAAPGLVAEVAIPGADHNDPVLFGGEQLMAPIRDLVDRIDQ